MRSWSQFSTHFISGDLRSIVIHGIGEALERMIENDRLAFALCLRCGELAFKHAGGRCAYSPFEAKYPKETHVDVDNSGILVFTALEGDLSITRYYADRANFRKDYELHGGLR